jgi:hypothetical protein
VKRGDVVVVVVPGELGKPRPGVIVQADEFNKNHNGIRLPDFVGYSGKTAVAAHH